jgi:hypothetical protein
MSANISPSADAELAIVIPAYKAKYLHEALESIASQTDRRFQVYVGDDCSPDPLAEVVREYAGTLKIIYHRFENNLGGKSLVEQWERCLRLTKEPWIWLFSDDDFMDKKCVAAFYAEKEMTHGNHDVYRFDTTWVNGRSEPETVSPRHPTEETGADFLLARLGGYRNSTLQEIIFSRQGWEAGGGIPRFPLAWCSDDAFIAQLGAKRRIRTIAGPHVYWRLSDVNISNNKSAATTRVKITAADQYVRWVTAYFRQEPEARQTEARRLTERWYINFVATCWRFLGWQTAWELDRLARDVWRHPPGWGLLKSLRLNIRLVIEKIRVRLKRHQ